MGDKSPQNQIKIGNLTVKLDPNNQQKNRRESNHERNYYRSNDRNYGNNDRYNDRHNERDRDRDRDRDRERNKYQNDSKNYNNKKNNDDNRYSNKRKDYDYDDRREKYKNYKNKSRSNSVSGSKQRHSHNRTHHSRSRSRSRSRTHSHHNIPNRNKNYINEQGNKNNQNDKKNSSTNNNNVNDFQSKNNNANNNSLNNNMINNNNFNNNNNNNMEYMNPNFMNYNEFFKKFYQMNQLKNNNQNANIIVPIGIPVNYFFNPNLNNMNNNNQMNKINNVNNQVNNNNNNNYIQNNNHTQNQNNNNNQNQAQKEEPSNTILITDLDTNITKDTLEDIFREKCLKLQISMPIDIRLLEALNIAYIIFPSVTSCVTVYNSLVNQKILINGKYFPIQFSPNLTQKYSNNRDTLTYVTQISSNTSLTTSMETTVHEDWYCVYCDSKNFSRRTVCFKCQKPKSINCRVVPVIKQKKIILGANGEILPNNSIIIQGKQVQYSNEGEVFIFF